MKTDRPLVIAHRGFRGIAPENTILAARRGQEAGAPWWELDVAASRDGELVILHDDSLARTTNAREIFPSRAPWTVYDFDSAELSRLDAGSWYELADPFGRVASGRVGRAELESFRDLRLPSLREALEFTRDAGMSVNVEIKDATGHECQEWLVERTVDLVRELGMVERTMISSFNHDYVLRCKAREPRIVCGALIETQVDDPVRVLKSTGAEYLNPGLNLVTEEMVRAVRAAGGEVLVWTVNEVADMRRLLDWGVGGIFSDFPDRLLALLGTHPG